MDERRTKRDIHGLTYLRLLRGDLVTPGPDGVLCGEYSFPVNNKRFFFLFIYALLFLSLMEAPTRVVYSSSNYRGWRNLSKKRTCATVPFIYFFSGRKICANTRDNVVFTRISRLMVFSPLLADLRGFRGNERWDYRN